jgi:hypothetical protein
MAAPVARAAAQYALALEASPPLPGRSSGPELRRCVDPTARSGSALGLQGASRRRRIRQSHDACNSDNDCFCYERNIKADED